MALAPVVAQVAARRGTWRGRRALPCLRQGRARVLRWTARRGRVRRGARIARWVSSESGQMAVELAVLVPVIIVVGLTVYNLMRFVELSALFDRVALDAVVSQGVAPAGTQSERAATDAVRDCIEDALDAEGVAVEVSASSAREGAHGSAGVSFPISPLLTRFTCTLVYRPWPSSFGMGGTRYVSPLVLRHERTLVVDRFRSGVVV